MRLLHLEDNPNDAEIVAHHLKREWPDAALLRADSFGAFQRLLDTPPEPDVILADFTVPGTSVDQILDHLQRTGRDVPIILVSGSIGEETAVTLLRRGVKDYVLKDRLDRLPSAIAQVRDARQRQRAAEAAERARRVAEERARLFVSAISEIAWLLDAEGNPIGDNSSWTRFTGTSIAEGGSQSWLKSIHPEDRERVAATWAATVANGTEITLEYRLRRRDGAWRRMFVRGIPRRNEAGRIVEWVGGCVDVTDFRAAQEEALSGEAKYRAVFEQASDGMVIISPTGEFLDANAQARAFVGLEFAELTKHNILHFIPPEMRDLAARLIAKLDERGSEPREFAVQRPDGTTLPVETNSIRLRDGRVLIILRDLTARRAIAEKLAQQAALIEQASDAIISRDLDGIILTWNRAAERIFGWTAEEAIGKSAQTLFQIDPTVYAQANRELLEQGRWVGQLAVRHKNGSPLLMHSRCNVIRDDRGTPRTVLSIETDITAQREREVAALRAERMESLGTLAGGIAHDLNNILAPISMGAGLLQQIGVDPDLKQVVSTIEQSAIRGAKLVRQILAFARGEEGRRGPVRVTEVVRNVLEIAEQTFPKNIAIRTEIGDVVPLVLGDATELEQVLLNLCVNARDAMSSGGALTVSIDTATLDAQYASMLGDLPAGSYVRLRVTDTGTGIPPEILDRIFDPFFTTKNRGQGTGLGLATSAAIVARHKGAIRVESQVGHGTTFSVFLPAEDGTAAETAAAIVAADPRGNGELILLIDDEPAILSVTKPTLEHANYRVLVAENGAAGVAAFAMHHHEVSLVITDMMMPVMDGIAAITAIRSIRANVAVLAISGVDASLMNTRAREAGICNFLIKPFTASALLNAVHAGLEEARTAR